MKWKKIRFRICWDYGQKGREVGSVITTLRRYEKGCAVCVSGEEQGRVGDSL